MTPLKIECKVHFERQAHSARKTLKKGPEPMTPVVTGRTPRVAKLMALALRFEGLLRDGTVANYSRLADLGQVTRTRITQIMNLLNLAPDIVEAILYLPRTTHGRDPIQMRHLMPLTQTADWRKQRAMWRELADRPSCV